MSMNALLLLAHGSRRSESRDEVLGLTERVAEALEDAYDTVNCAFLQWAEPLLHDQLQAYLDRGVTDIVIMPYLLAAGAHVLHDIPEAIEAFRLSHPGVRIRLLPHIGLAEGMTALISQHARSLA